MKKLFDMTVLQENDIDLGETCRGETLVSVKEYGTFEGEKLRGTIVPIGMGVTYAPNPGINDIQTNMLLKTDDGAYILMELNAYFDTDIANEKKLMKGEMVDPKNYYYKGIVKFQTSQESYKWLERKICVCNGIIENWERLVFEVYMI